MELEKQVCTLELAKRLKQLGVIQNSLFYWQRKSFSNQLQAIIYSPKYDNQCDPTEFERWAAFTVAELGEMLPPSTEPLTYWITKISTSVPESMWQADLLMNGKSLSTFCSAREADIRAKILIYLLENSLMEIPS